MNHPTTRSTFRLWFGQAFGQLFGQLFGQSFGQSFGLACVTSLYLVGGELAMRWPEVRGPLRDLAYVWVAQFVWAWATLAFIQKLYPRVASQAPLRQWGLAGVVAACALGGTALQVGVLWLYPFHDQQQPLANLPNLLLWNATLAVLLVLAHSFAQRSQAASHALHSAGLQRLALTRDVDAAQLQLLQAQGEPHFLFNALANVRRLLRTDRAAAHQLLTDLLHYLHMALPALRVEHSTLGREADLVRAFLAVYQVRMGARLRFDVQVPAALAAHPLPPMLLLTLVENALKHGLAPLVEGGSVHVAARADGARLVLTVADTGCGMGSSSGTGTGLANLRARLRSVYGHQASLALAVNEPRGVVATVVVPQLGASP
jgi:signal transduction histidine kinase